MGHVLHVRSGTAFGRGGVLEVSSLEPHAICALTQRPQVGQPAQGVRQTITLARRHT